MTENKGRHKIEAACHACKRPIAKGQKYTAQTVTRYATKKVIGGNTVWMYPGRTYYFHQGCN